jgi:hypothetical protein
MTSSLIFTGNNSTHISFDSTCVPRNEKVLLDKLQTVNSLARKVCLDNTVLVEMVIEEFRDMLGKDAI